MEKETKKELLSKEVKHIDIKKINSVPIIEAMKHMSFSSRDTARAAEIYEKMLLDKDCAVILTLAGSTSAAGCLQVYVDLLKNNMVDAIVATGASIVDMDFFEAIGFKHYQGSPKMDDHILRQLYIDRIYDTLIDEDELQEVDQVISNIADSLDPKPYSSREFIEKMGKYLVDNSIGENSLVRIAYEKKVPIFCPAFSDSSAGLGLVKHQVNNPNQHLSIDSVKDFRELTQLKIEAGTTGLFIVGGGTPKNFTQDVVIAAELLGYKADMHKYAIQVTVADVRDGALSSSTLEEAHSWGKVETTYEQMVFAEATTIIPLITSYSYHKHAYKNRNEKRLSEFLNENKIMKPAE